MFTVDVEFKSGVCIKPQFLTQREAVAYAGRMAQDSAVKLSAVRGLDASNDFNSLSEAKRYAEESVKQRRDKGDENYVLRNKKTGKFAVIVDVNVSQFMGEYEVVAKAKKQ